MGLRPAWQRTVFSCFVRPLFCSMFGGCSFSNVPRCFFVRWFCSDHWLCSGLPQGCFVFVRPKSGKRVCSVSGVRLQACPRHGQPNPLAGGSGGGVSPRLGTEHRSQNKNVFQTSAEQKQNNRTKFPNKANGPNKTTEQKATSERLKTNSPRTSNKTKAEQNKKTLFTAMPGPGRGQRPPWFRRQHGGS